MGSTWEFQTGLKSTMTLSRISAFLAIPLFVGVWAQTPIQMLNMIQELHVKTASCEGCGMDESGDSGVSLEICGHTELLEVCCQTGDLDNPRYGDFYPGKISTFKSQIIGNCNKFALTNFTTASDIWMEMTHTGMDDVLLDWVEVFSGLGMYQCLFPEKMIESNTQKGKNCTFIPSN